MSNEETPNEAQEPQPLSLEAVQDMVIKTVNAAVSTRLQRNEKKIEDTISTAIAHALSQTADRDEPAAASDNDEVKGLRAKMKDLESKYEAERSQREQEYQHRMISEERSVLQDALVKHGVPADRMKAAVALLYAEEKRLERNEQGEIQFLVPEKGYTDRVSVAEGVSKFLGTSEGKVFLPPREAAGSGNTGGRAGAQRQSATPDNPNDLIMNLANLMAGRPVE